MISPKFIDFRKASEDASITAAMYQRNEQFQFGLHEMSREEAEMYKGLKEVNERSLS